MTPVPIVCLIDGGKEPRTGSTGESKMNHYMQSTLLTMVFITAAGANDGSKATTVTFHAPVEAPGIVLPAGVYTFRVPADESKRNLVEIFKEGDDEPLATVTTLPASRSSITEDTALLFEQKPDGRPEVIRELFYPAEKDGIEFVYASAAAQTAIDAGAESEEVEDEFVQFMRNQPLQVIVLPLPPDDEIEANPDTE
jgi:hypothetical protein